MIKKIKRLSTNLKNLEMKLEILHNKFLQIVKCIKRLGIGIFVYIALFVCVLIIDSSITKESSVLDVLISSNINTTKTDQKDVFISNNDIKPSLIITEKIPDAKHAIFSNEESIMYNIIDTSVITGPELDFFEEYKKITAGSEIYVLGYNEYNVAKILYDEKELYIDGNLLTNNKDYIFENVDDVVYAKKDINAYVNLETNSEVIKITSGKTIHMIGTNNSDYIKAEINQNTYYIKKVDISNSSSYKFEKENKTMYAKGTVDIKETQDDDAIILSTIESGTDVNVIGINDSSYYKVNINGTTGYVFKEQLTDTKSSLYPYLTFSSKSAVKYNTDNALNGIVATVPEDQKTEENIYLLAKLIYCEAGGQGYDGQRAVATVVVNRMFDGTMGDTVKSVIYRKNQFSPVGSGKIDRITPTEENIQAAKDVLLNGYRSFPAYVLYFQSIRDGYFKNHHTYCTMYNDNWTHPQYFSYKLSDYEKYKE